MRKKIFILLLLLAFGSSFFLTGCTTKETINIVFLGDSIGDGFAGVSPVSERENYGYYGIIGKRNEYKFINRSVSSFQSYQLLELIQQEDNSVRMMRTVLSEADIIHISILGNDLLFGGLQGLFLDAAQNKSNKLDQILATAKSNFEQIVSILREINPDGHIIFQTLYNPVFPDTPLLDAVGRGKLTQWGYEDSEYREIAGVLIDRLNDIFKDYLIENPGAYHLLDIQTEFQRIYLEDNHRGESLIFNDGIHPSNIGHAIMADYLQLKLEDLGLADAKLALKNYKTLRIEQLNRMFKDKIEFRDVVKDIKAAKSCYEVTEIYFAAIDGIEPLYY